MIFIFLISLAAIIGIVYYYMFYNKNKILIITTIDVEHREIDQVLNRYINDDNWDIAFLQEVQFKIDEYGDKLGIIKPFRINHYWGYFIANDIKKNGLLHANAILFKSSLNIKIEDYHILKLPITNEDKDTMRNGIILNVKLDNMNISLINVHLSYGVYKYESEDNINFILDYLKNNKTKNIIFGGNFNTRSSLIKDLIVDYNLKYTVSNPNVITLYEDDNWISIDYFITDMSILDEKFYYNNDKLDHARVELKIKLKNINLYDSNNFIYNFNKK